VYVKIALALAIGYLIGAKSGAKDLDRLTESLKALCETDEFADVVAAARSQVGTTLRELAGVIDGGRELPEAGGDLVAKVRHLVGHE
jgi:hypothetical protein